MIKKDQYHQLKTMANRSSADWKKYYAANKKKLEQQDVRVHEWHDHFMKRINCLECARCCKDLGPRLDAKDVERMGKALRMKPSAVEAQYL